VKSKQSRRSMLGVSAWPRLPQRNPPPTSGKPALDENALADKIGRLEEPGILRSTISYRW
jgi:hypothetical protein